MLRGEHIENDVREYILLSKKLTLDATHCAQQMTNCNVKHEDVYVVK